MLRNTIVLGSGRSGTSLVAGTLVGAGYFMGDDLLRPSVSNPKGYWESNQVNDINEALIEQVLPARSASWPGRWDRRKFRRRQRWAANITPPYHYDVDDALRERMVAQLRAPYCLKDPRFSYTLPAWDPLLGDARFLVVFRHPATTIESIKRYRATLNLGDVWLRDADLYAMWAQVYENALGLAQQDQRAWLFVEYNDLITRQQPWDAIEALTGANVDLSFRDPTLNRTDTPAVDLPYRVEVVWDELLEIVDGGGDEMILGA